MMRAVVAPDHIPDRAEVAAVEDRVRERLAALDVEPVSPLQRDPEVGGRDQAASKPIHTLQDARGRQFLFKEADEVLIVAEEIAFEVRREAGRPALATRGYDFVDDDGDRARGILKPLLDFDPGDRLGTDTTQWTELQRQVMLAEHPWEWVLDNLDAHDAQYALLGPERYPLNIDWDRAYAHGAEAPLTRFAKHRAVLTTARHFLYADFVRGRVDLAFERLHEQARAVEAFSDDFVTDRAARFAGASFSDAVQTQAFIQRVVDRKRNAVPQFEAFVRGLEEERLSTLGVLEPPAPERARQGLRQLRDQYQETLHAGARSRMGDAMRSVLRWARRLVYRR